MAIQHTPFDARDFRNVAGDVYVSQNISDSDLVVRLARENVSALEKKAAEKQVALYRIEVQFGRNHHVCGGNTYGMITLWESGTKLHGGGDSLLYTCPGKHLKRNDCASVIPGVLGGGAIVVCPSCALAWNRDDLVGQTYYRLPIQKWAYVVHRQFVRLSMNADICVKYFYDDIRAVSEEEQLRGLKGDLLGKARGVGRRVSRVYPLDNIIKDVNGGADLYTRFLAFLRM